MVLERGTLLNNRYRIIEILGQGGMGSVYRAVDENLGVEVAVKDNLFTTDEYARQFRREAIILANLRHPNLPRVTDHFVIEGQGQYLVMDYIEGEDLRQRMERVGEIPEEEVIVIGAAVCDALAYLGTRKPPIIHRDIKPGNVKITPQGHIFLVDFGLAKTLQGSHATTTGARAMTPGYSPPEQYGTARTDQRSDIFSLGATLYAALTSVTPEDALARAMDQEELTPIRRHNSNISKPTSAAIEKALQVRPENRYQNAEEFKQELLETSSAASRKDGDFIIAPPPEEAEAVLAEELLAPAGAPLAAAAVREVRAVKSPERLPRIALAGELLEEGHERLRAKPRKPRGRGWGCWVVIILLGILLGLSGYAVYWYNPSLPYRVLSRVVPLIFVPTATPSSAVTEQGTSLPGLIPTATATLPGGTATLVARLTGTPPSPLAPTFTVVSTINFTNTPVFPPTPQGGGGGQLAFVSDTTGANQIYIINIDGTGLRQVTEIAEGACQPDWSPDVTRLIFISPCTTNKDYYPGSAIFIINIDGTGFLPLPTMGGGDYDPDWSPDGMKIIFTSLRNSGRPQIYTLKLDDNSVVDLSTKYDFHAHPSWSTDGTQIIFSSYRGEAAEIWVMDADGQNARQFSPNGTMLNLHPKWSPDGQSVLFTQIVALGGIPRAMIAPYQFENYTEYRVGQESMPMRDAAYSPDGLWVAFEGWLVGGSHDIFVLSSTGAGRQQISILPGIEFDPAWKPIP